ncbi:MULTISPECIES: C4-dicarboxylate transporter DctA [unclassified Streptomyces]|uniref:C4-dicarboxylate transporter DctA n=1 Tax=unclassified Streptomyces TaxID=2593676 RepID=UPI0013707C53|nr:MULTISPECIES: C4-dicarboxylate transporter DctA [unclassified Streptomyces]NEA00758.1 C4-dicarboxylate transporter DctA [Streptomyces sp. SID10116]MYY86935.1 C4-dicarboxylate transporter DctA [Streptomyces sp. SID335]MYZ16256.1 C4-dicarboxylate transporter DctA [Streptomyces sp. SID337]NDZ88625.1 C4-dicarboxylate transporter DctA [Streptomyces sp. SID10115]NEB49911.1 C4-dicarboxylate transporter DctA [Streptomyces sp. SID339]
MAATASTTPGTPPSAPSPSATSEPSAPWYRQLYFWVLTAIVAGILTGWLRPSVGVALEPVGTTFVSAIKMLIAPIVFLTIVAGIGGVDSLRRVGRVGLKSLLYFQAGTLAALAVGLVAVNLFQPGAGVHAHPGDLRLSGEAARYVQDGEDQSWWHFLTDIVPSSAVGAFAEGNILQVIFFAVLFGVALKAVGPVGAPLVDGVNRLSAVVFKILHYVMLAAPVGAFGAMAYTIGKYGISTLTSLGRLIGLFYGTSLFFVVVVLGGVLGLLRINIFRLLHHLREEFLIVLGTSSSESVLPRVMAKLEGLGLRRDIVGLTVPTGYSFNLDGSSLYLSLAAVYIAQATDTPLTLGQQLGLLAVMILTSKGSGGVTGAGFIALAATLSAVGTVPAAGIMLIFGIDKFMSECRALTNLAGNSVATLVVARWEGVLDTARVNRVLRGGRPEPSPELSTDPSKESAGHGTSTAGKALAE